MSPNPSPVSPRGHASPWVSDNGDGTYKNPILFADYSDPDVIRVGDDFYLTASSFNCVPALPILHSKDLVNWTIIGHAVERLPERFDTVQHGNGIWAPSIRHHDGWFWVLVGDPDWGILMTKAKNPAGPWEPPHVVLEGKGLIDPCPLWDDDGNAYLVHAWAKTRAGINSILTVHKMSPDGKKLFDDGTMVFDGRNNVAPTIEGPKFYKRNDLYYILAPAGGVQEGWQLALRSKNPLGPYEAKRVLEQGSTDINGPHQGGWVETKSGESWFIHFQDRGAYGRIVHMQPVNWVNDWPLIGVDKDGNGVGEPGSSYTKPNVGKPYPVATPQTSNEFDGNKLGLQWQWQANPKLSWCSLSIRPGWLRLTAVARPPSATNNLWMVPNLLLQKLPAQMFTATTKLEFTPRAKGDATGLVVMGEDYTALMVTQGPNGLDVKRVTCHDAAQGNRETVDATASGLKNPIWLRVSVETEAKCTFSYSSNGKEFTVLGSPFAARPGRWIGAKVGLVCIGTGGHADFDWFRID
jgi:beta-xylosidase